MASQSNALLSILLRYSNLWKNSPYDLLLRGNDIVVYLALEVCKKRNNN